MSKVEEQKKEPNFQELDAEQDNGPVEVDSYCVNCGENGSTRLLLIKIPYFKEVILSSFQCENCGEKNTEIQSGAAVQAKGCTISLKVTSQKDLNRQVVKQESASFAIPEIEFEAPAFTQKGEVNTIEGLLMRAVEGLEQDQPVRRHMDPDSASKIDAFLDKLRKCLSVEKQFTLVIDDCSGNSFLENPYAPKNDDNLTVQWYKRTPAQSSQLGFSSESTPDFSFQEEKEDLSVQEEVHTMPTNCPNCSAPTDSRMKIVAIPHFKEVIIMALTCDTCGYKSSEVKSGSGIEAKGRKITLTITDPEDLNRDILKSETCHLSIPEVEFEVDGPTLGGRFTTVEGLLTNLQNHMKSINPFGLGDATASNAGAMKEFLDKVEEIREGKRMGVHLIMDDPAGNSYLQNYYAPDPDPELLIEEYERTEEQNDELGILYMKTENYETTDTDKPRGKPKKHDTKKGVQK